MEFQQKDFQEDYNKCVQINQLLRELEQRIKNALSSIGSRDIKQYEDEINNIHQKYLKHDMKVSVIQEQIDGARDKIKWIKNKIGLV